MLSELVAIGYFITRSITTTHHCRGNDNSNTYDNKNNRPSIHDCIISRSTFLKSAGGLKHASRTNTISKRKPIYFRLSVLKKALEADDLSIERKEDKICFPWFTDHGIDGEAKAYMQLISGIAKRAKMLTRVTATESPSDNDKFTMRLFLVSLNFKGAEYAFARKFLLRNLTGNSSWRTEGAKARHDARKIQQEIEAPEVTIEKSFEGGKNYAELS